MCLFLKVWISNQLHLSEPVTDNLIYVFIIFQSGSITSLTDKLKFGKSKKPEEAEQGVVVTEVEGADLQTRVFQKRV